ncbi:hypothetical protein EIP86_005042 [Pleurotus ostreatoroseus]|nr:hypothetical protein EIP86_005042 [Pleurotus ostreatoroseus]
MMMRCGYNDILLSVDPLGGYVHRIAQSVVVKCDVRVTEALTMDYIARHTTIPVPRVHDVFTWAGRTYIAMDYIKGSTLRSVWPRLNQEERIASIRQLQGYIEQLRNLQPPNTHRVQAVDGNPCYDSRMRGEYGPYDTIDAFNEAWGHKFVPDKHPEHQEAFKKVAGRPWKIMLAHGDLGPHNILWRDGKIVAIIDWEFAGWLPEYWDYVQSWKAIFPNLDGQEWWRMLWDGIRCYPDELEAELCVDDVLIRC